MLAWRFLKFFQTMKGSILKASLKNKDLIIMAKDMVENKLLQGISITILKNREERQKVRRFFNCCKKRSATYPLRHTHFVVSYLVG